MRNLLALVCIVFLGWTGCASPPRQYAYEPGNGAAIESSLATGATYRIPEDNPMSLVRVDSIGFVTLQSREGDVQVPSMHLRMTVNNYSSTESMRINVRRQLLTVPSYGVFRPAYVNAETASLPEVTVLPDQQQTLDLYYPLPGQMRTKEELPAFSFRWQIETPRGLAQETTPFNRIQLMPQNVVVSPYAPFAWGDYGLGWGRDWWYDSPTGEGVTFYQPVPPPPLW